MSAIIYTIFAVSFVHFFDETVYILQILVLLLLQQCIL